MWWLGNLSGMWHVMVLRTSVSMHSFVHLGGRNAKWCKASSYQETQDASICLKALTQVSLYNNTHLKVPLF